ncbi:hypothetical protein [Spirosoma pomorum]
MATLSFETELYRQLTPFFSQHQFVLIPQRKQFRRRVDTGFQNIILSPTFYGTETVLEVNFGCRNEQVEQIAQQFLHNPLDYQAEANTLLMSIGRFTGAPYTRYSIQSGDELARMCRQIEQFFLLTGFDFLATTDSLAGVDDLLNRNLQQASPYVYNQTHRCYKGLITAQLNHNPYWTGLTEGYRHLFWQQTQNPYEQQQFERLITYLNYYSAN